MLRSMKTYVIFGLILLMVCSSYAEEFKKYKNKSGKIEYKLSGNAEGKTVTYWDDYGYKEVQITKTKTKIWGMTTEENKTVLALGAEVYEWKEDDDKVFKSESPLLEMWEDENYNQKDVENQSLEIMESMGFEKTGEEKIIGKLCDVYEGIGKTWVWKKVGVALKTDVNVLGIKIVSEATEIKLNFKVDKNLFKYPKDRTLVTVDNAQEVMGDEDDEEVNPEEIKEAQEAAKKMLKGLFGK